MTKIVSAFPGTGKSYFSITSDSQISTIDLDSGPYTLGYGKDGKPRNPDFPVNYMNAIKENLGKSDVLFVGCQPEVVRILRDINAPFVLVYPERTLKKEYIERFTKRKNTKSFVDLLSKNWDVFFDFLESQTECEFIVLKSGQHISDIVDSILIP